MAVEKFEFQSSEILPNEGFSWDDLRNTFTVVENCFEFQSYEMLQNEEFSWDDLRNTFTMVEEFLISRALKCSRMKDFNEIWLWIPSPCFEKIWVTKLWNAPELSFYEITKRIPPLFLSSRAQNCPRREDFHEIN